MGPCLARPKGTQAIVRQSRANPRPARPWITGDTLLLGRWLHEWVQLRFGVKLYALGFYPSL